VLIPKMPDVLTWRENADELVDVHRAYVELVSDAFSALLVRLHDRRPPMAATLEQAVVTASDGAFERVLTAPETTFRLLWLDSGADRGVATWMIRAFEAEAALAGAQITAGDPVWTALGDACIGTDGCVRRQPQVPGLMALDFESPLARAVDLGSPGSKVRPPLTQDEIRTVIARLEASRDGISASSPDLLAFVAGFTKVLVVQRDPADPETFSSGSTGQYVGRSFIANPHLDKVDIVGMAEALVHEAIHSLLYMQERRRAWVSDPELRQPVPRVVSPWSGVRLAVRPYLQACFVWYGLLNFWGLALETMALDPGRVRIAMLRALRGFLRGPLLEPIAPYAHAIDEELLLTITVLQQRVEDSLADAVPDAGVRSRIAGVT
jgi:hypothetical protein